MRFVTLVFGIGSILLASALLVEHSAESDGITPYGSYPVQMIPISGMGHQQFINMPSNIKLTLARTAGGGDGFTGPFPFVAVSEEPIEKDLVIGVWTVDMSGSGTVAGNPDISVKLTGHITPAGVFTGVYTMGYLNDLPGGYPIEYQITPKEAAATPPPQPTATATSCPPVSGIAGQECPGPSPAPTTTPTLGPTPTQGPPPPPQPQGIDMGCETHVEVTGNGPIPSTGDADGIRLDCGTQYNARDLQTGNPNAQTTFDTDENTVHVTPNGPILGSDDAISIDLDGCTPVQVNFSMTSLSQALSTQCKLIIKAFGSLGSGHAAGSELIATYESEPFTLNASALFPPFGSGWDAPGVHATLTDTSSHEVVGYISGFGFDVSPYGDVNCNMSANSVDAALVLQLTAGLLTTLNCQEAGDVNRNGDLNAIDVSLILQYTAGLLTSLPP